MVYDTNVFQRLLNKTVKVAISYGSDLTKFRVFTGQILFVSDTHIMLVDKYNKEVIIGISEIKNLEVVEVDG